MFDVIDVNDTFYKQYATKPCGLPLSADNPASNLNQKEEKIGSNHHPHAALSIKEAKKLRLIVDTIFIIQGLSECPLGSLEGCYSKIVFRAGRSRTVKQDPITK